MVTYAGPDMHALDAVASWPVGAAAVAVADWSPRRSDGSVAPGVPAVTGDADRVFPWASVTKTATALAVLVAVEEGTLDLDAPAGPPGLHRPSSPGPRLRTRARPRPTDRAAGRPPDLFERRLSGTGGHPRGGGGHAVRPVPVRGGPGAAGHGPDRPGGDAGRAAGRRPRRPAAPIWPPWPPSGRRRRWSARDVERGPFRPVRRPRRGPAGVRAVRPLRLGARGRAAGPQASALDGSRRTRPPPTGTSGSPARSCGSTPWPGCCAAGWPTARSASGRPGRGRPWPRRCWPRWPDSGPVPGAELSGGRRGAGAVERDGRPVSRRVTGSTDPHGPRLGCAV